MAADLYTTLFISFIVGGAFVALQSIIAERVPPRVAGLVLSLPSTLGIGYFFMGLTLSTAEVVRAVPVTVLSLGASLFFIVTYIYIATCLRTAKSIAIPLCIAGATAVWLLLAAPLAISGFSDLMLSLCGFTVMAGIAYALLARLRDNGKENIVLRYSITQTIGRAVFAGLAVALIVWAAHAMGPFWGGILSVFPAASMSALIILHWYRGENFLLRVSKTVPLGYGSLIIYVLAARYAFPLFGAWGGTLFCYAVVAAFFALLLCWFRIRRGKAPIDPLAI